jgi:Ca-activated chloride channel homolog
MNPLGSRPVVFGLITARSVAEVSMKGVLLSLFALLAQNLVVDVNLRQVDVFVEDQKGEAALDLTVDDFKVVQDGRPAPVKHFALEVAPVAVGIVLDRSSSIRPVKKQLDEAARYALDAVHPNDQVFLMTFATDNEIKVNFTTDHRNVLTAIQKAKLSYGTRFYDAMADALAYLTTSRLERKMLIVLSDGADHYSTHNFEQVLDRAMLLGVSVYFISWAGDDSSSWLEEGRKEIRNQIGQLATLTGGRAYFPLSAIDCLQAGRQIMQSMQYRYRLGFYSSSLFAEWTEVQVSVSRSGGTYIVHLVPKRLQL